MQFTVELNLCEWNFISNIQMYRNRYNIIGNIYIFKVQNK